MKRNIATGLLMSFGIAIAAPATSFGQTELQNCPAIASPSGDVVPPMLMKRVDPQYPEVAATEQVSGAVTMDIVIAADGSVRDVKVVHGLPQLIPNATHAMKQWQYRPARMGGVAVACKAITTMNFRMLPSVASVALANNFAPQTLSSNVIPPRPVLPPPPDGVLRVSAKAMEAQIEKRVEPAYPSVAAEIDAHGVVFVLLTISKDGEVSDARVLAGADWFRDPALAAVKQWKFRPYEVDGEPRDVQTMVSLDFAPTK